MKLTHHVFIIGCAFLLFAPAILIGPSGIDLPTQSLWVRNFADQVYNYGEIYPRWLMDMTAGYGSPVFFFYPPLAYFFSLPFAFLGQFGDFDFLHLTGSAWLAVVLSGYAFYHWMRKEGARENMALTGALVYMSAPVSICSNFYHLMLFSSLWAYMWVPLVLMYARMIMRGVAYAVPCYALCVAGMILTNIPVTLVTAIMVTVIFAVRVRRKNILRVLCRFVGGSLLAAGIAAIYLLPADALEYFININLHWTQFVHWADYPMPHVSFMLWVYYALLAAALVFYQKKSGGRGKTAIALGVVGLLLLLPFGDWLWTQVPLFIYIQISDRLFLIPALALAWLAAQSPALRKFSYGIVAMSVLMAFAVSYSNHYSETSYATINPIKYDMYHLGIDTYPTYMPGKDAMMYFGVPENIKALGEKDPLFVFLSGDAHVKLLTWEPEKIVFDYTATQPTDLILRRLFFPGFIGYGGGNDFVMRREEVAGRIRMTLPPGTHHIIMERWELISETLGEKLTFFSLCATLLLLLVELRRFKKARKQYHHQQWSELPVP